MKRLSVLSTVVVMALATAGMLLAQSNPFVGTWKLNPSKLKLIGGAPAKEETATLQIVGGQDEVTVKGTAADGSPIAMKYEIPDKGGTGEFLSGPYDGVSGKWIDDNTHDVT